MTDMLSVQIYPGDEEDYYVDISRIGAASDSVDLIILSRPSVGQILTVPLDTIEQFGQIVHLSITAELGDRLVLNADDLDSDNLQSLRLTGVEVRSNIGADLFLLQYSHSLHTLHLNSVTGLNTIEVADSISALANLRVLKVVSTDIGIEGIVWNLNSLQLLEELVLDTEWMNRLPDIEDCINLREVVLNSRGTHVQDTLEDITWTRLTALRSLSVSCNTGGTVPVLSNSLRHLSLSHNELTGTIPTELFTDMQLSTLDLSHNQLEGYLPNTVIEIDRIDLSYNRLMGHIQEIYADEIVLSNNLFTSIGYIDALKILDVSHNNIVGELVQSDFYSIVGKKELNVYGNNFGTVQLPVDADTGLIFIYYGSRTVTEVGSGWQLLSSDEVQDRAVYKKLY